MGTADLFVLGLYFIGITALGVWSARRVHSMGDFIMPRRFGKAMMMMHAFGTGTHSDQAVSVASKTYTNGLSGIWYQWLWLFATPFYWLIAPVMRRFRALTTADVFEARYSRSVAALFAVVGLVQFSINIGVMLKGSSAVIDAATGGAVSANLAIIIMTAMFVTYGIAGGLGAAIITDFIQGVLTIIFSFLLLPLILSAVGGMAGLRESIPTLAPGKNMLSLVAPGDIGLFYIVIIALNALVGIVTQPHTMGNCAAGRTENEGQIGFMGGNFIKRFCTIAWCLTGLAAVAYFAEKEIHPDLVFGEAAREFLPRILPGLLGLFTAAIVASVMSSCDSFMIASSGLFTGSCYKPLFPGRSDRHYLIVARVAALAVVAGGVLFAYSLEGVVQGLEVFWKIAPMMGIAFWLGLFWRRTTVAGAWAATLAAFAAWWISDQTFFIGMLAGLPGAETLRFVVGEPDALTMYLPWQMVFYLCVGLTAGVGVSLFTRPVDREKLERFYALTRTPVKPDEEIPSPCTLPEGAEVPPRRMIFPNTSLEIPIPSKRSVVGFLIGWAMVGLLVGGFIWIVRSW